MATRRWLLTGSGAGTASRIRFRIRDRPPDPDPATGFAAVTRTLNQLRILERRF